MIDFKTVKSMSINGVEVKDIKINGVTVWKVEEQGLPKGYTELEYVAFDSRNQGNTLPYFELDYYFNSETDVVEANIRRFSLGSYYFGSRGFQEFGLKADAYYWKHYIGSILPNDGNFHKCVFDKGFVYDGETKWQDATTRTAGYTLIVGSIHNEYQPTKIDLNGSTAYNMGNIVIKRDNIKLFDLVPCKNPSGVVGFYDMVNKVFRSSESEAVWTE